MDVESMQVRTASIVQVRMQCIKNMGNSSSTVVWHWQILQLLQTGAEIWAQFCNCTECWVHPVCCWWCWPKLKFTGCPYTFHGMGDIASILPGRPTLRGNPTKLWKWVSYKLLAKFRSAILLHFLWGYTHRDTKYWSPNCSNPTASDLKWKVSFPHHSWSFKSQHYTGTHVQASVLSILCHDRYWPWRNTYLCDTAKRYSTMFIFMYDHPLWWKSIIIIKNKPEPSNLHGIVLRLNGFHTLINSLEVVDHIMAG